jgi:hypothetical protein
MWGVANSVNKLWTIEAVIAVFGLIGFGNDPDRPPLPGSTGFKRNAVKDGVRSFGHTIHLDSERLPCWRGSLFTPNHKMQWKGNRPCH